MAGKSKSTGEAKDNLEILPDAWERFERAVDTVIKWPKPRQWAKSTTEQAEAQRRRREKEREHSNEATRDI